MSFSHDELFTDKLRHNTLKSYVLYTKDLPGNKIKHFFKILSLTYLNPPLQT